jgi:DNA-binding Xre family transcriptional regulator
MMTSDIAQVLEMSQVNVSRIERQQNLYLSTLAEYVEALGGELDEAVESEADQRDSGSCSPCDDRDRELDGVPGVTPPGQHPGAPDEPSPFAASRGLRSSPTLIATDTD